MKKLALIFTLLCILPACYGTDEEEAKRELTQQQVQIVRTELQGIERAHSAMGQQLATLQSALNDFDAELTRVDARLVAANGSNKYLLELSTVGFGPSPGRWVMENPAWPTNVLLLFALVVVLCWVLYRMRLSTTEVAAMAEVDRVLARLNNPAPDPMPAARPAPAPVAPVPPAPAPAAKKAILPPAPPAAKATLPVAEVKAPIPAAADVSAQTEKPAAKTAEKPEAQPVPAAKRAVARRDVRRKTARPAAKKCKVEGCPNKHRSKGYCNKHYQQWRRSGNPEGEKED